MKKLRTVGSQLMLNYIIVSITALLLILAVIYIGDYYTALDDANYAIDFEKLEEDYFKHGLEYAYKQQGFLDDDGIEVINSDYQVLESFNSPVPAGYTYSQRELNETLTLSADYEFYTWYLNNGDEFFFLLQLELLESSNRFYIIIIIIALLLFLIGIYLFTLNTSKRIIGPLKALKTGTKEIKQGNLNHKIEFRANNELGELRDTFNSMTEQLASEIDLRQKAEKNREVFIKNISHDIKTPLTNIIGYTETLIKNDNLSKSDRDNAKQVILKNGITANNLLSELRDLSKIDTDSNNSQLNVVDICEFIRLKVIDFIPEFELKNINYNIEIPERPIKFTLNRVNFNRALDNIITNSIKYNHSDFSLFFGLREADNYLEIVISDNGLGIPREFYTSIFEPSVRVDQSRNTEGSGLGLAITRKIIESRGGSIKLDELHSPGCRFIITLPK